MEAHNIELLGAWVKLRIPNVTAQRPRDGEVVGHPLNACPPAIRLDGRTRVLCNQGLMVERPVRGPQMACPGLVWPPLSFCLSVCLSVCLPTCLPACAGLHIYASASSHPARSCAIGAQAAQAATRVCRRAMRWSQTTRSWLAAATCQTSPSSRRCSRAAASSFSWPRAATTPTSAASRRGPCRQTRTRCWRRAPPSSASSSCVAADSRCIFPPGRRVSSVAASGAEVLPMDASTRAGPTTRQNRGAFQARLTELVARVPVHCTRRI
jgi:hypothetical protein